MIEVLIQVESGSRKKRLYHEKTLEYKETRFVSRPYPYPYGFILETKAADGGNADCYVFGDDKLQSGSVVTCDVIGLLEQIESGEPDHKVLATVTGKGRELPDQAIEVLQDFIYGIFSEYPDTPVIVGPIHSRDAALDYIRESRRR